MSSNRLLNIFEVLINDLFEVLLSSIIQLCVSFFSVRVAWLSVADFFLFLLSFMHQLNSVLSETVAACVYDQLLSLIGWWINWTIWKFSHKS